MKLPIVPIFEWIELILSVVINIIGKFFFEGSIQACVHIVQSEAGIRQTQDGILVDPDGQVGDAGGGGVPHLAL